MEQFISYDFEGIESLEWLSVPPVTDTQTAFDDWQTAGGHNRGVYEPWNEAPPSLSFEEMMAAPMPPLSFEQIMMIPNDFSNDRSQQFAHYVASTSVATTSPTLEEPVKPNKALVSPPKGKGKDKELPSALSDTFHEFTATTDSIEKWMNEAEEAYQGNWELVYVNTTALVTYPAMKLADRCSFDVRSGKMMYKAIEQVKALLALGKKPTLTLLSHYQAEEPELEEVTGLLTPSATPAKKTVTGKKVRMSATQRQLALVEEKKLLHQGEKQNVKNHHHLGVVDLGRWNRDIQNGNATLESPSNAHIALLGKQMGSKETSKTRLESAMMLRRLDKEEAEATKKKKKEEEEDEDESEDMRPRKRSSKRRRRRRRRDTEDEATKEAVS
ncbi:hypothetical protein Vi05172_g11625 [Venturia inaequalis]|nr:hypothetical protein Vi05172_g11625 [Venturia inaequalis]